MRTIDKGGERGWRRNVRERAAGRWDQTLFTHGDSSERPRCGGKRWKDGGGGRAAN